MIASFVLSRTLVPTMAMYLLKPHDAGHELRSGRTAPAAPQLAQSAGALPARLRGALRAGARGLSRPAGHGHEPPQAVRHRLHGRRAGVASAWRRSWAATSSRRSTPARSPCTCARRSARASRTPPPLFDHVEDAIRQVDPGRTSSSSIVDNIGLPISGINTRLFQHRRHRPAGRRHLHHA